MLYLSSRPLHHLAIFLSKLMIFFMATSFVNMSGECGVEPLITSQGCILLGAFRQLLPYVSRPIVGSHCVMT